MKAWLVTWEWGSDSAAIGDYFAAVLPSRIGERKVREIVEFMYLHATANVAELAACATQPKSNPYRAMREVVPDGVARVESISCGAHPMLYARKVSDFKVSVSKETGIETMSWREPTPYRFFTDPLRVEHLEKRPIRTHTRQVTGRLRNDHIWNRQTAKWFDGFRRHDV